MKATSVYGFVRGTMSFTSFPKSWRRGQESNLPRLLRTDNGFEDREGHQAPFTLRRIADCRLQIVDCRKSTIDRANNTRQKLSGSFLDCFDDGVEVRPIAGIEFGME